jgi:hypothetical protein
VHASSSAQLAIEAKLRLGKGSRREERHC